MFMVSPASLGYIKMIELHDYVQFYLLIILVFVLWFYVNILLDFGVFNVKLRPAHAIQKAYTHILARKIAHLGWLEVVWTIIPILILTAIAIPSFKLLYALDVVHSPLLTLRCIGNQWYWTYECELGKPNVYEIVSQRARVFKAQIHNNNLVKNSAPVNKETEFFERILRPISKIWGLDIRDKLGYIRNPNLVEWNTSLINNPSTKTSRLINVEKETTAEIIARFITCMIDQIRDFDFNFEYLRTYRPYRQKDPISVPVPAQRKVQLLKDQILAIRESYVLAEASLNKSNMSDVLNESFDSVIAGNEFKDSMIVELFRSSDALFHKYTDFAESFAVDSYMLDVDDLQLGAFRLLEVDNFPQLPADVEIRLAVTGTDVIHSFAVPSLGVKIDAIPGRLNQFGIRVRSPGTYYGQCSELCGVGHGFMPIKVQFLKVIK